MIKIVESQKDFGSMNAGTIRYANLTEEDKKMLAELHNIEVKDLESYDLTPDRGRIFRLHRERMGEAFGFDGRHMFMADQEHKKGSHFIINQDYIEANPNGWTDIPEDILVVTDKLPGVVIGHPVADCPVVMMVDKKQGISAIGHCSAEMIDKKLPMMIGEVLRGTFGSRAEDIYSYVSSCAGDTWTYDFFPKWAQDLRVWDRCIEEGEDGLFHIRLKPAVLKQLLAIGVQAKNIRFSMDDTITDDHYYSNSMASKTGKDTSPKFGRHFAGLFYDGEDDDEITIQKGRGK